MSDHTIVIRGGRVIDPASGLDATADVLLRGSRVEVISTLPNSMNQADAAQCIDAEGCLVVPGLLDIHVHLREPDPQHEETIASGAAAAVGGGFTTICCMPNTRPPLDSPEQVRFVQRQADAAGKARVFVVACATKGRRGEALAPIDEMAAAGAVGFSDDGDVVASAAVMVEALVACGRADKVFMQHCQEPTLTRGASMNAGEVATRLGQLGWPAVAEEVIIERDVRLNRRIGARYHAQHLSSGESVEILRRAQADGLPVTGEASPHHLLLTDEACETLGTMAKMNPPLRTKADVTRLKEGLARGVITVLATDHAPHPLATKEVAFEKASFGIVGLDCALALYIRALIDDGVVDWSKLLAMMTINPARVVGLDHLGLGRLEAGGPADVTIIDPDLTWTIDVDQFASAGRNCPFQGWSVRGRSVATIVAGRVLSLRTPARMSRRSPIKG